MEAAAAVGGDLSSWAIGKIADYTFDSAKASVTHSMGLETDSDLMERIGKELSDVEEGQKGINQKVRTQDFIAFFSGHAVAISNVPPIDQCFCSRIKFGFRYDRIQARCKCHT